MSSVRGLVLEGSPDHSAVEITEWTIVVDQLTTTLKRLTITMILKVTKDLKLKDYMMKEKIVNGTFWFG